MFYENRYYVDYISYYKKYEKSWFIPNIKCFFLESKSGQVTIDKGLVRYGNKEGEWYTKRDKNDKFEVYANYRNNKMDGPCRVYQNHCLISENEYSNGVIIKQKLYNKFGNCMTLPDGVIIVWKACIYKYINCTKEIPVYVKMLVPHEAKRVTPFDDIYESYPTFRGRVEYAYVVDIFDKYDNTYNEATSINNHYNKLIYKKGEIVKPDKYDDNPYNINANGIHVQLHKLDCDKWFNVTNYNSPYN